MEPPLSIWTPVIIARLKQAGKIQDQLVYRLDPPLYSLEDLKIKIKIATARLRGRNVEVMIKLDLLFLMRDRSGKMQLISRLQETCKRIPVKDFSCPFPRPEINLIADIDSPQVDLNVDVSLLSWDGEYKNGELKAAYLLEYMVLVLKQREVNLPNLQQVEAPIVAGEDKIRQLEEEVNRVYQDKARLDHQIFCYEKNITSLKKGIYRAENRNVQLNHELNRYKQLAEQLQQTVTEKEKSLLRLKQHDDGLSFYSTELPAIHNWGSRIKRMFLNHL